MKMAKGFEKEEFQAFQTLV